MKIIKELADLIEEELEGAENYAKLAGHYKAEHPELAATFYDISLQEMHHVNLLHDEVTRLIRAYRDKHGEPPAAMLAIYDWQHKKQIEEAAEVKRYQEIYKSS